MITVDLKRQDDGVIIGTANIDEGLCYSTIQQQTISKVLYINNLNAESITLDTPLSFNDVFDIYMIVQEVADISSWIGLFGGGNTYNRCLLSLSNKKLAINLGDGSLKTKTGLNFDTGLKTKIRIRRDANNVVYISFNDDVEVNCFTKPGTFTLTNICKSYDKIFKGYLHKYSINGELFDLSEQSGNILTGSNGSTHTINSSVNVENMWQTPPNQTPSIQVYNEGIGGNNTQDLINRAADVSQYSPDKILLWVGTNDSLNAPSKILQVVTFESNLLSLVQQLKSENQTASITLLNVIPCTDSILKTNHDYTPYYGDENLFDLNSDVIPTFNAAIQSVATSESVSIVDANTLINNNLSTISDGTHLNANGYDLIADLLLTECSGKSVIVCFGDSLTNGSNAGGGFDYPTKLSQKLNI